MIPGIDLLDLEGIREDLDLLGVPEDPAVLGLFEGYGGLTEGVRAVAGGRLVAYAEIDPSSCKLLEQHYPGVPNLGDVSKADYSRMHGTIDVIAGGFPCQDVSHAGLGAGIKSGTRSGLWYEFARAIAELRPSLVVIENVRGLRSAPAGLKEEITDVEIPDAVELDAAGDRESDPWGMGGSGRGDRPVLRALGAVLLDLSELGYVGRWSSVRASDVGAPHQRERVFIHAVPEW